jgi:chromosome segregation ATPase
MRLTAIKLAGFKSFVDPTTFRAPTNRTGIVGPNGCGKSNIIDAVRWVMGEGSARVLRGEQMADVIFSGSSTRKPVGTAQVELLFDNSDGQVAGEFAGFNGRVAIFPEWHPLPAKGHHRPVSRHRSGAEKLFHYRTGHDLSGGRCQAG